MDLDFGMYHLWQQGDFVSRTTLLVLLGMSALSWIVILIKTFDAWRGRLQALRVAAYWRSGKPDERLARLRPRTANPFLELAQEGQTAAARHDTALALARAVPDRSAWITRALTDSMESTRISLQSGLVVLSSVGSTAPFVGLFGTVWGIYHALMQISGAGQVSVSEVAGPIGEALIMTAFGLGAAIPAVLGYNLLVRSNRTLMARLRHFAHELHAHYVAEADGEPAKAGHPADATASQA